MVALLQRIVDWRRIFVYRVPGWMGVYVFCEDGCEESHKDGDGGLVDVGDLFSFDYRGGQYVDCEYYYKDECFNGEGLRL